MAQQDIPEAWRKEVLALLATEDHKKIVWDPKGRARYEADFHPDWPYEVYASFKAYLGQAKPTGCPIRMDFPPGDTWEFLFTHKHVITYGKILLSTDRKRILLFSAHKPLKDKLSCE
jgi:hypothetical protein